MVQRTVILQLALAQFLFHRITQKVTYIHKINAKKNNK
jgi:hypothetical protein